MPGHAGGNIRKAAASPSRAISSQDASAASSARAPVCSSWPHPDGGAEPEQRHAEQQVLDGGGRVQGRRGEPAGGAQARQGHESDDEQRDHRGRAWRRRRAVPSRWWKPAAATIGASRITRVSLTTTATASAAVPAVCGGGDHLPDVVHRGAGPRPEDLRTQAQRPREQRQHADRQRAAQGHERHRQHGVLLPDPAHRGHRPDRGGPADGESRGHQQRHAAAAAGRAC